MAQREDKTSRQGVRPKRTPRCAARTAAGKPCRVRPLLGTHLCPMHTPKRAAQMARSKPAREIPIPPLTLDSPADVRREAQRAVAILSTKLPAQQAGYQIASLLQVVLKAMELEQAMIEKQRTARPPTVDADTDGSDIGDGNTFGRLPDIGPARRRGVA